MSSRFTTSKTRVALATAIMLASGLSYATNAVPNSDMEKDKLGSMPEGWIGFANGDNNAAEFKVTNTKAHSGKQSFQAIITAADGVEMWKIGAGPSGIPVKPNQKYRLSAWVKGEKGSKLEITVNLRRSPWTIYGTSKEQTLSGKWQEVTFDTTVGETEDVRISVHMNYPQNNGKSLYLDDIQLTALTK